MKKLTYIFILFFVLFSCENDNDDMTPAQDPQVIAEFRPNLSELNLFTGNLGDLNMSSRVFEYQLNTPLFTDYAHKQRIIALPSGTSMTYVDDGFPVFPENTVIAKTFYYNNDETNLNLGKTIIETRILIKRNGTWELGNYKWNNDQTDATLDTDGGTRNVSWINANGASQTVNYEIPNSADCFTCHSNAGEETIIGPRLRTMNFNIDGVNQLQTFINQNLLIELSNPNNISSLPNWEDTSLSLEDRARAYLDINCAHCHIPGGFCENESTLDLAYETSLQDSNIIVRKASINARISNYIPQFSMPYIGTSTIHTEGVALLQAYLNTL